MATQGSELTQQNSNAIVLDFELKKQISNALLYVQRTNSNAIVLLSEQVEQNSNAIVQNDVDILNNSNSINYLDQRVINNSNSINHMAIEGVALARENSNSILALDLENDLARFNSNAFLYCCRNTSNSILSLDQRIENNSNAILSGSSVLAEQNSNAILALDLENNLSRFNSNALLYALNHGDITITSSITLENDIYLHESGETRRIVVPASASNFVTVDAQNNTIRFANDDGLIDVADGKTLTIENAVLVDFSPSSVELNSSGNIRFGDGIHLQLAPNETDLAGTCRGIDLNYTWSFVGSNTPMLLDGMGHRLNLNAKDSLSVLGTSSLTIDNVMLKGVGGAQGTTNYNNIKCVDRLSTICLSNVDLILTNNFTFSNGYMNFLPDVVIRGNGHVFTHASDREAVVKSDAILTIDHDVTLKYEPANSTSKTLFKLEDANAMLYLRGSTLDTSSIGLNFTVGHIFVEDKVIFYNSATSAAGALQIADDVDLSLLGGARVDVYGYLNLEA